MLESRDVEFEHEPIVEEALYLWGMYPGVDFADCMRNARAAHLGRARFMRFDLRAARLPRAELLA